MILLGLRVAYKPDLNASPAELVYGTTLSVPGEFFQQTRIAPPVTDFVTEFRATMQKLRPIDTAHHSIPQVFVSKELQHASHVFVRNDSIRPSLSHPYDGPYAVLKRSAKYYTIHIRGRKSDISIDRLKPAFLASNDLIDDSPLQSVPAAPEDTSQILPDGQLNCNTDTTSDKNLSPKKQHPNTTTSGRRVTIPLRFR